MDQRITDILRTLEESLWRAETRFDNALMDQVFAPDFVEFGRSGRIYTRAEMLLGASGGSEINVTLPLQDLNARFLSKDIAQVTYISEVLYSDQIERANRSSIWGRNGDGWLLHFHQGTPIDI